jgi:hypothetical protein
MTTPTIGDRIMSAVDAIDTLGWARGIRHNTGRCANEDYAPNSVCALGALEVAFGTSSLGEYDKWTGEEFRSAVAQLDKHIPVPREELPKDRLYDATTRVVAYNNFVATDVDDMRSWFTKAALDAGVTL